jgi:tellurite resistance protein TerC
MEELWHWLIFAGSIFVMLLLDLVVFHRDNHEPSLRESAAWTVVWITLALVFNGLIWYWYDQEHAIGFLTGYIVEKALSMDNVFVFAVIFRYFQVPRRYEHRILFWGILGAIVMRLVFIAVGIEIIQKFEWVLALFGVFLIYTAVQLARHKDVEIDPSHNLALRWARRLFRVSHGDHREHGQRFFVREAGRLCITPMFLVLLVVESSDVLFAVDSVPAIIVITKELDHRTFIAFTSNIFAILGLRALYFLLSGVIELFEYLHYGLAVVLGFIGVKMVVDFLAESLPQRYNFLAWCGYHKFPAWASLAIIATILGISILWSIVAKRHKPNPENRPDHSDPS